MPAAEAAKSGGQQVIVALNKATGSRASRNAVKLAEAAKRGALSENFSFSASNGWCAQHDRTAHMTQILATDPPQTPQVRILATRHKASTRMLRHALCSIITS